MAEGGGGGGVGGKSSCHTTAGKKGREGIQAAKTEEKLKQECQRGTFLTGSRVNLESEGEQSGIKDRGEARKVRDECQAQKRESEIRQKTEGRNRKGEGAMGICCMFDCSSSI